MFKFKYQLRDETDGEGSELGGAGEAPGEVAEGAVADPEYLFGDVTADEAAERFGYVRDLPEHLRGLESRVSESVDPVMEQLRAVQEKIGTQPVFDPKLEKFAQALVGYDEKLAPVVEALIEDLKGSMTTTPLGPEALEPHVSPMLQQTQQQVMEQVVPVLLDSLPFDANAVINRDPSNPDNVLEAQTDLQKDFAKWWEQSDAPTRRALSEVGVPYVQAMQRFGKWRAEHIRKKGEAAGNASARLSGAAQRSNGGRSDPVNKGKLVTAEDGFASVFKK